MSLVSWLSILLRNWRASSFGPVGGPVEFLPRYLRVVQYSSISNTQWAGQVGRAGRVGVNLGWLKKYSQLAHKVVGMAMEEAINKMSLQPFGAFGHTFFPSFFLTIFQIYFLSIVPFGSIFMHIYLYFIPLFCKNNHDTSIKSPLMPIIQFIKCNNLRISELGRSKIKKGTPLFEFGYLHFDFSFEAITVDFPKISR